MASIGYLGLGTMGSGMVQNLVKAGHEVTVWNRSAERAESLEGVQIAGSIAEAVQGQDFVMYCLADDAAVGDVVFGADGVLDSAQSPTTVIDLSTISPQLSDEEAAAFAERGVAFLDAPVFGSRDEAAGGGLRVVVGGDDTTFAAASPVLAQVSETVHHMGGHGSGARMKLSVTPWSPPSFKHSVSR